MRLLLGYVFLDLWVTPFNFASTGNSSEIGKGWCASLQYKCGMVYLKWKEKEIAFSQTVLCVVTCQRQVVKSWCAIKAVALGIIA